MTDLLRAAAEQRRAAAGVPGPDGALRFDPAASPAGTPARSQVFGAQLRSGTATLNGKDFRAIEGYASVTEQRYTMYDVFGPYDEIISRGAFEHTLSADPDVAYLLNHRGVTMARTTQPGRLELAEDDHGLRTRALVNPARADVGDMLAALDDGDLDQMSFAFRIMDGRWSPDYMTYRIDEVDLDRGDVSVVNFGANPYTSVAARSSEVLRDLDHLPAGALREAADRLARRGVDLGRPSYTQPTDQSLDERIAAGLEYVLSRYAAAPATAPPADQRSGSSLALLAAETELQATELGV